MKKKIKDIVNDRITAPSDKMSTNPYDGPSKKLQRIGTNLHLLNILDFTAKYGPMQAVHCSPLAKSKSLLLRLIDPVDGWLYTGKEPDLGGLPKGDVESEIALIGDADLSTCRFRLKQQGSLGSVQPHFGNTMLLAYPAYIKQLWQDRPEKFDLQDKLFYCEETDGTPHSKDDMQKLNKRAAKTAEVRGRKVEIALQTNGTVRTNSATDTYNPLLMGFVPQDSTFSSVMTNLVLGEPEERGFVVSESFLRAHIEVEVNGVVKTTPQRAKSPASSPGNTPVGKLRDRMTRQQNEVRAITTKMKSDLFKDLPSGRGYEKAITERIKKFADDIEQVFQTKEATQQATAATPSTNNASGRMAARSPPPSSNSPAAPPAKRRKTSGTGKGKGNGEETK